MKFKEGYKSRDIAGEHVIIMHGKFGNDMTRVISLNESSLLLWNELQGVDFDQKKVADVLLDNYEIEESVAMADAQKWIDQLKECKLIVE